eukprot:TRINITY_DN5845_c0_g1_i1.p1 TRINITY_DN5845_c0_g1~~TRINITY_DN5845_c0_g1_i1.p1  ORF type:complete len:140 (+),score=42.69 TRINITY_DN5845_c0_g1_i1:58-477(+)
MSNKKKSKFFEFMENLDIEYAKNDLIYNTNFDFVNRNKRKSIKRDIIDLTISDSQIIENKKYRMRGEFIVKDAKLEDSDDEIEEEDEEDQNSEINNNNQYIEKEEPIISTRTNIPRNNNINNENNRIIDKQKIINITDD